MRRFLPFLILLASCSHPQNVPVPAETPVFLTTYVEPYSSGVPEADDTAGLQCPIPRSDRVFNHTGIQCVFSSLETIGRWAECENLTNPPLTDRRDCKGMSGPSHAAGILNKYSVKFEQTYGNREAGLAMIRKAMSEGRGCLFNVPGHAMVIVHFDEAAGQVKYVDNSDRSLRVQTMTMERFNRVWGEWVMIVYADPDVAPGKASSSPLP